MKYLKASFFKDNRERLINKMKNNSVMVLLSNDVYPKNGDQNFPIRQQSDFFYFTGIKQEHSALIISKDSKGLGESMLFIIKPNLKLETWEGKKLSIEEAKVISGIEDVQYISSFEKVLPEVVQANTTLYLLGEHAYTTRLTWHHKHQDFLVRTQKQFPKHAIASSRNMIDQLRVIKSPDELEMMQWAIDITNQAFNRVLEVVRPDMFEYEIEAEISYIFKKSGVKNHAYDPIIAGGVNACTLHYIENKHILGRNELLLMDFGAEWEYYAADLSRTIPVNGRFTERQKLIYNIVLDVQKKVIPLFVPGHTINLINEKTKAYMQEALETNNIKGDLDVLFPHGTSHFLGIDVHDVGAKDLPFEKGMVLTCEPGLYIKQEKLGVRIENDIMVDDVPVDLMADIIREPHQIEEAMKR